MGDGAQYLEFFFDPMCPWAYQTSVWLRRVRSQVPLDIHWRFFSLEEANRPDGKRHPWERPIAYGWTPMRVAAWLRRRDMTLCDAWYERAGRALHEEGRRPYDRSVAVELLAELGLDGSVWDDALADPTTHDEVHADHEEAVQRYGAFGVPLLVLPGDRAVFGPVVLPAPDGDDAVALWELTCAYGRFPGLYELKTPKRPDDLVQIAASFEPYLSAREWPTIEHPAP